jgi:hypothetical protein
MLWSVAKISSLRKETNKQLIEKWREQLAADQRKLQPSIGPEPSPEPSAIGDGAGLVTAEDIRL